MDVDRVACFHDSVLGYSSMLYELKPHAGFREMKEVLQKLWRALENDNNLPEKLVRQYLDNAFTEHPTFLKGYIKYAKLPLLDLLYTAGMNIK